MMQGSDMQATKPLTKPSKQRKMIYQAPDHVRHKLLAAHLSPELRGTHVIKNFPVRTGDTVRVMRGDHKGFEGKISQIDRKKYRVYIEGLTREKVDGTAIFVAIHPSKIMITRLDLDDKWRKKVLERKKKILKKPRPVGKKPKPKLEEKPPEVEEVKPMPEEKEVVEEEPPKKKPARMKRKTVKRATRRAKKAEKQPEEPKKKESKEKEKPKTKKKRTPRKTAKKAEGGGK